MVTKIKIILGGGISGLIWSFYNGGKIISNNFGGQMNNNIQLGPRYLHKNEYSKKFLQDLKIQLNTKIIKVGYFYDGEFHDNIDEENKIKYFKKSRNNLGEFKKDKTILNSNKSNFEVFEINFKLIIKKLIEEINKKGNLIYGEIDEINCEKKYIQYLNKDERYKIEYDECISTISLKTFLKLSEIKKNKLISIPVSYLLSEKFNLHGYDFVYFIDKNIPYHRASKIENNVIFEWIGRHTINECKKLFGKDFIFYKSFNCMQIINKDEKININNIKFIGRYGTWNKEWKTEKVIEEAIKNEKKN